MKESDRLATEAVGRLLEIEQRSSVPTKGFWKAVVAIASNEAALRAVLHRGAFTSGMSDPTQAVKPIVTDAAELVFKTPQ